MAIDGNREGDVDGTRYRWHSKQSTLTRASNVAVCGSALQQYTLTRASNVALSSLVSINLYIASSLLPSIPPCLDYASNLSALGERERRRDGGRHRGGESAEEKETLLLAIDRQETLLGAIDRHCCWQ